MTSHILAQVVGIDPTTTVSVAVIIVVLGAAWKLSSQLTRIEITLDTATTKLAALARLPELFGRIEQRVDHIETEVEQIKIELHNRWGGQNK